MDGSRGMCTIAERNTGISVRKMLFSELDYHDCFDGVWACSSLLHIPSTDIASVMHKIRMALTPHGVLYTTFKKGEFEGERDGRYYKDMTGESLINLAHTSGFDIIDIWDSLEPGRDVLWVNALMTPRNDSDIHDIVL